jgi:DNA polymerase III alpha subunit (gram-positive type)
MKTYVLVDIESNGPIPGDYSMTQLGAVVVDDRLDKTFKVNIKQISEKFEKDRVDHTHLINAMDAKTAMQNFKAWIKKSAPNDPVFVSDNNGYDWMFVCWYFWHFLDENPFGYSSTNLNTFYKGISKDLSVNIRNLRTRELTHDALEDAIDNAKVMLRLINNINSPRPFV